MTESPNAEMLVIWEGSQRFEGSAGESPGHAGVAVAYERAVVIEERMRHNILTPLQLRAVAAAVGRRYGRSAGY